MGLLSALTGNVSDVAPEEIRQDLAPILIEGEQIEVAFKGVRDLHVFTSKRLIVVDKQGIRGNKVEYISVPYKSVYKFSVENAGSFDMDSDLKIWAKGVAEPISLELKRGSNLLGVQQILARGVLNA